MNKPVKIILLSILSVLALVGIILIVGIYEVAQLTADPLSAEMENTMATVCGTDHGCGESMFNTYLSCHFFNHAKEEDCFHQFVADLNRKSHPELANAALSDEQIIAWSNRAAKDILDFDYKNLEERLARARSYFTPGGWQSYYKALNDANIIEATKARKLVISLVPVGDPKIEKTYIADNIYIWEVQFPITIQFGHADPSDIRPVPDPKNVFLFLKIARSSSEQNSEGIGIVQWVTTSTKTN